MSLFINRMDYEKSECNGLLFLSGWNQVRLSDNEICVESSHSPFLLSLVFSFPPSLGKKKWKSMIKRYLTHFPNTSKSWGLAKAKVGIGKSIQVSMCKARTHLPEAPCWLTGSTVAETWSQELEPRVGHSVQWGRGLQLLSWLPRPMQALHCN